MSGESIAIDVAEAEPQWNEVTFVPEVRVTRRGEATALPEELKGWLKIGTPLTKTIQAQGRADSIHRFGYVQLAVSMRPAEDEPFQSVWLKIMLAGDAGDAGNEQRQPIAWSLHPKSESTSVEFTSKLNLDASLKFKGAGIGAARESGEKFTRVDAYLEAFNELRSDPLWEFNATEAVKIRGNHRLHMIVRYGAGAPCRGLVELKATVQRKRWGLIEYTAALDATGTARFELAG
jgi:hypothetical protein